MISHPATVTFHLLATVRVPNRNRNRREHLPSNDDAKRVLGVANARDDGPRRVFLRLEKIRHEPRRPRAVFGLLQRAKRGNVRQRRLSQFRVGSVGDAEVFAGAETVERARVDSDAGGRDDDLGVVGDAGEEAASGWVKNAPGPRVNATRHGYVGFWASRGRVGAGPGPGPGPGRVGRG